MLKVVYSMRDVKSEIFSDPVMFRTDAEACRSIKQAIKSGQDLLFSSSPEDFVLYRLGVFNDITGTYDLADQPYIIVSVGTIADEIKREAEELKASV